MKSDLYAKVSRRLATKYSAGPGGMHCPCCGASVHPSRAKPKNSRAIRRSLKQALRLVFISQE